MAKMGINDRLSGTLQADGGFAFNTVGGTGASADQIQGNVAHDAVDSGNPVKIGGYASLGIPSVVAGGDRVNAFFSSSGAFQIAGIQTVATDADAGNIIYLNDTNGSAGKVGVANAVFNGATWDRQRGDTNHTAVGKGLSATRWRYTSGTSPILSNTTTAVTIKTAGGAGVKNAIDSIQLTTTAFTASVPLAIRDGAGGTVLWALTVPTAGFLQPTTIVFEQPIVGTANTLLEVVTTTANTAGTVTLNVQGHTEV